MLLQGLINPVCCKPKTLLSTEIYLLNRLRLPYSQYCNELTLLWLVTHSIFAQQTQFSSCTFCLIWNWTLFVISSSHYFFISSSFPNPSLIIWKMSQYRRLLTEWVLKGVGEFGLSVWYMFSLLVGQSNDGLLQKGQRLVDVHGLLLGFTFWLWTAINIVKS